MRAWWRAYWPPLFAFAVLLTALALIGWWVG